MTLLWNLGLHNAEKKKAPVKKTVKKKKTKKEEPVVDLPPLQMLPPGTYMRENGILMLTGKFEMEVVMPIVHQIFEYNMMEPELAPERLTLMINSPGGRIDSCLTLIDAMNTSDIPVDTMASGLAASCGILTLMSGAKRYASKTCQIMSHQYAAGSSGKEHELYGRMKSFEQTSEWMVDHYKECTGLSEKAIRKELLGPTDVWMSAQEALSFNIIDQVVDTYKGRNKDA
jgi:ATP-dependent Clp protease protease subunit